MPDRTAELGASERGVSEVLSYTLIFSLIIASIAVVSVSGLGALQDAQNAEQMNNAERAFAVFADNVADIHRRGAPSRATEIDLADAQLYTGDNITINVTAEAGSDVGDGDDIIVKHEVRPLIFEGEDERRIVYAGGAMFRTNRDGGVVLRKPPVVNKSERLYAPLIALRSVDVQAASGSTVLVRTKETDTNVTIGEPAAHTTFDTIHVNVTSPRYELWADALEERNLDCTENDVLEHVNCEAQTVDGDAPERVYATVYNITLDVEQ